MTARPLPRFILRGAGLCYDDLEKLGDGEVLDLARALAAHEAGLAGGRQAVLGALQDVPRALLDRPARRRVKRAMANAEPITPDLLPAGLPAGARAVAEAWNREVAVLAATRDRLAAATRKAWESGAAAVHALASTAATREAVWLSSPSAAGALDRLTPAPPQTARDRANQRRAMLYLQRLHAKNDTASFFGPHAFGRTDSRFGEPWLRYSGGQRTGRRFGYVARFVVEALARAAAAVDEIRRAAPLRRHPLAVARDGRLWVGGRCVRLPAGVVDAIEDLDGAGWRVWEERLGAAALDQLTRAEILLCDLVPADTELHDAEALAAQLGRLASAAAADWAQDVEWLVAEARAVAALPLDAKRARYDGARRRLLDRIEPGALDRPRGTHAADRQVFFEEAEAGLTGLELDAGGLLDLPGFVPLLRVHAAYAVAVRDDVRRRVLARWDAAGLGDEAPLDVLLDATSADMDGFPDAPWMTAATALWDRASALVDEGDTRVELSAGKLASWPGPRAGEPFACSPDVLLRVSPAGGAAEPVLGEVHHGAQVYSFFLRYQDGAVRRELQACLEDWAAVLTEGQAQLATLLTARMTGKAFTLEWPGLTIERMARSAKPRSAVRSLHEVRVRRDGERLTLHDGDTPLQLAPTTPVDPIVRLFASPVLWGPRSLRFRRHLPRVTVGGVVWARESWKLEAAERERLAAAAGDPVQQARVAGALCRDLGLPRRVFVSLPTEPKPVHVDLASPAGLEVLAYLAGRDGDVLRLTEMLPAPDELALRVGGRRYTSEVRLSALVEAGP